MVGRQRGQRLGPGQRRPLALAEAGRLAPDGEEIEAKLILTQLAGIDAVLIGNVAGVVRHRLLGAMGSFRKRRWATALPGADVTSLPELLGAGQWLEE